MMINKQWNQILKDEFNKTYFKNLMLTINDEYKNYTVYPKYEHIFNAFKFTDYNDVKVVFVGQDPYHGESQAHGLSFSVPYGIKIPKSLQNIFIELKNDLNLSYPQHGNLESWARQGILLLNTVLTVRKNLPNSHKKLGWETFTDKVISELNNKKEPIIFILWGKDAQTKGVLITNSQHTILKASHPSPLSAYRGFFGCRHFSKINDILLQNNQSTIDWQIK